jgi:hypothetical protein
MASTMTWTQHFYVGDEYLGEALRGLCIIHAQPQPPVGYAFFCPECSALWSTCCVEGRPSMVWTRHCVQHPDLLFPPAGSLWLPWDSSFTDSFPEAVLRRELELHLLWIESAKEIGYEQEVLPPTSPCPA